MNDYKGSYSRGVLVRLIVVLAIVAVLVVASFGFINQVYFRDQLTPTGLVINGSILALFVTGLLRIVGSLWRYMGEERMLARFGAALEEEHFHPAADLDGESIVARRYNAILALSRQNAPINHAALASALAARESTRLSLPKFINNILILTGVFGTIVSLSIALLGASNVLGEPGRLGDMGLVIHGMSTALSTTITAIVCYLIYGYFYLKLIDTQTHVLSGIEQVTTLYLLPRYAHTPDNIVHRVAGLVESLHEVAGVMRAAQSDMASSATQLHSLVAGLNQRIKPMSDDMRSIRRTLREGFRLPALDD